MDDKSWTNTDFQQMTNEDRVRYIFDKHPYTRFGIGVFGWKCLENFHGAKFYATERQYLALMTYWSGIERARRDVLKEDKYKLPLQNDAKRYEKRGEFRHAYSKNKKLDI